MKYYKARLSFEEIQPVDVERESESFVWIDGRRHAKISGWDCYFPTFNQAKSYFILEANKDVEKARSRLRNALDKLQKISQLEEFTETKQPD